MKIPMHQTGSKLLSTMLCCALVACGGGGEPENKLLSTVQSPGPVSADVTTATASGSAAATTTAGASTAVQAALPDVRVESTNLLAAQSDVPVTFGQPFAAGALQPAEALVGRLDDGTTVPLQVDVKALHADGSVRHAIISALLPSLGAGQTRRVALEKSGAAPEAAGATTDDLMMSGFSASVHATIDGVRYSAHADDLIKMTTPRPWLAGAVANEWHVSAPLTDPAGAEHPHLSARFAIRWYQGAQKARVDVTVENNWAYEPAPQNFTYDAEVLVNAQQVYARAALTHYHHARWRKVFWFGGDEPALHVKHNTAYLIGTRAIANYDQGLAIPETRLASMKTQWNSANTEPMGIGLAVPYMPGTGGRSDIGLLPSWAAVYVLSMDKRAKEATMGTADLAGSWSAHYRDKKTDQPVSLMDYPYMTVFGTLSDSYNRTTKTYEKFPACATSTACKTPYTHDASHQPSMAYLPYLVSGDYYYLEELQFWALWNVFQSNPGYRENIKGLIHMGQVRGQAWVLRTLAEAAWITPDSDRLKGHLNQILDNNLDWYNTTYTYNPSANVFGALTHGYAMAYSSGTGLAPWQDDFFTSAVGRAAELGYAKAQPLLAWKAKFPISRMTDPGACWIVGAMYSMKVRDSSTSPFYTSIGQAFQASNSATFNSLACASAEMATLLKLKVGEMTGYSAEPMGYPSNMQPALAYSADAGGAAGKAAWDVFMNRSVKPNYANHPQFAIVPR